ncbi:epsilon-toxin family protein [Lysinibacillus sp. MHQ-1]|nr:epsilon-toxin family protein [Lysinibacillus sp. MHQ-1]
MNFKQNNVTNVVPIFMGENTFINNSEQEQTFNITSFSESITKSTSTSIESGFKSSITTKGKVGIPFVAEGEVSAILEFNLSTTISTTSTITANSQAVKVPPNKIYRHLSKQKIIPIN